MATARSVRTAYRGYLVELTLTPARRGRWHARWTVFRAERHHAVAHGRLAAPHPLPHGAQAAATRGALAWIETHSPNPAPVAAGA